MGDPDRAEMTVYGAVGLVMGATEVLLEADLTVLVTVWVMVSTWQYDDAVGRAKMVVGNSGRTMRRRKDVRCILGGIATVEILVGDESGSE